MKVYEITSNVPVVLKTRSYGGKLVELPPLFVWRCNDESIDWDNVNARLASGELASIVEIKPAWLHPVQG